MNIGIDIRAIGYQRTGDETYTLQLLKLLAKLDRKNQYFLYTDIVDVDKLKKVRKLLSVDNKNFKIVAVSPTSKLFWTMYSLPKRAKQDKLDVLHVQYITPLFLSKKIKLITTIHDISFARYPEYINIKDLIILKLFIKRSLKRADKIIAVSQFTKNEIVDVYKIKKNKISVIHNGGVAREFKEDISDIDVLEFRTKYGIIKPYLLFLGTLQPRKNIAFLIEAFIQLKLDYDKDIVVKDLLLVLRGKRGGHNYDSKIDEVLKNTKNKYPDIYKQIKFIGYISNEDAPLMFKGATAFCFTSVYEGFGLPLLEAMSVGTPVIANGDSCFPEIIDGAGLVYKASSQKDLIEKIRKLLGKNYLREELISRGKKRMEFFSWDKNARQTIELYKEIANS